MSYKLIYKGEVFGKVFVKSQVGKVYYVESDVEGEDEKYQIYKIEGDNYFINKID